jgi:hypothetical protein
VLMLARRFADPLCDHPGENLEALVSALEQPLHLGSASEAVRGGDPACLELPVDYAEIPSGRGVPMPRKPTTSVAFCALRRDGNTADTVAALARRMLNLRRLIQASEAQNRQSCSASNGYHRPAQLAVRSSPGGGLPLGPASKPRRRSSHASMQVVVCGWGLALSSRLLLPPCGCVRAWADGSPSAQPPAHRSNPLQQSERGLSAPIAYGLAMNVIPPALCLVRFTAERRTQVASTSSRQRRNTDVDARVAVSNAARQLSPPEGLTGRSAINASIKVRLYSAVCTKCRRGTALGG